MPREGRPQGDRADRAADGVSHAWAEALDAAGRVRAAELRCGEGFAVTAVIAAETALRVAAGAEPGAWTPRALLGADLVEAAGCTVTLADAGALRTAAR
ncbi:hypothetical protein AB0D08_31120 [Kitasatospora sp. NPDC048540]|uniref:hypothetical protein n=1 Tax=Kitasatospora sp. NPDC048540 TaxID=3155634 RepID=UPI0033D48001